MSNFQYKARDRSGKLIKGTIVGVSRTDVARTLEGTGYIPISIEEAERPSERGGGPLSGIFKQSVKLVDLNMFTRQFLTLQRAGLPILMSLNTIEKQLKNPYFKDIVKEVSSTVEKGSPLSSALEKYPAIFNELYVNMVRAGEASGLLDDILDRLAILGEKELENKNRVKAATRYPLIATIAMCLAFVIVVTFVIPKFAGIFAQFKADLPLPTRIMLGISTTIRTYWYLFLLAIGGIVFGFKKWVRTKGGRFIWDGIKLRMPVFGPLLVMLAMSRFTRITAILIKSGLPILQVLDMVTRTVDNAVLSKAIDNIANSVREGKGLTEPIRLSGMFPPMVIQMVAIGEETGKIDELLLKVAEYYDEQADYMIRNMSTLIEPIFIVALGGMILLMALAIFLPMWNMISLLKQ